MTGCEILGKAEFMNPAGRRAYTCSHAPAGRSGYSKLRVVNGTQCRGYSEDAGDTPGFASTPRILTHRYTQKVMQPR
jgi:hypothetical protein